MAQVGTVKSITGVVTARNSRGETRELHVGDIVYENEIITTDPGASAAIELDNRQIINLSENAQAFLDESVTGPVDVKDAVIDEVEALQAALEEGEDIPEDEETAAGEEDDGFDYGVEYDPGDQTGGNVGSYLFGTAYGGDTDITPDDLGEVPTTLTLQLFAVTQDGYTAVNAMDEEGSAQYVVLAVDEAGNPLASQPDGTVTVNVTDGTATQGLDYVSGPTYAATVGTVFDIAAIDDALADSGETFNLSLADGTWSNDGDYDTVTYVGTVETTIYDEDTPDSAYTLKLFAVVEGENGPEYTDANAMYEGDSVQYVVLAVDEAGDPLTSTSQPGGTVTVNVTDDTATQGLDYISGPTYTATVGTVFDIASIDDVLADNGETFNLSLADGSWSNDGDYETVTYDGAVETTIYDEGSLDNAYTLKLFAVVEGDNGPEYTDANAMYEGDSAQYVVLAVDEAGDPLTSTSQPGGTVTVNVMDGTATQGDDYVSGPTYTATVGTVFDIAAIDDAFADSGETFNLALADGTWSNDAVYEAVTYEGGVETTIYDEGTPDNAYTLKLFAVVEGDNGPEYTDANAMYEGDSAQYVVLAVDEAGDPLTSTSQPGGTVTVNVTDGTATQGLDYISGPTYTATVGTVFDIASIDDVLADSGETFNLTLADGTWSNDAVYEAVTYEGIVETTIYDEGTPDNAYTLKLFAVVEGDNGPEYTDANAMDEGDSAQYVVFAVDETGDPLASQPGGTVTVNVTDGTATQGDDYVSGPTYTATVGTMFDIASIDDTLIESDETFNLSLAEGTWSNDAVYETVTYEGTVETTIYDDDDPPPPPDSEYTLRLFAVVEGDDGTEYTAANAMNEGDSAQYVVLAVDEAGDPLASQPGGTVTVNVTDGTATRGDDYVSDPTYTATVGDAFDIASIDDAPLADNGETFNLSLEDGTWSNDADYDTVTYAGTVETTIYDEDPPPDTSLTLKLFAVVTDERGEITGYEDSNDIMEGGSAQYVVLAVDESGVILTDQPGGTVDVNVRSGTATEGVDYGSGPYTATVGFDGVFNIASINDDYYDDFETFSLALVEDTWSNDDDYDTVTYQGDVTTTIYDTDAKIYTPNILLGSDGDDDFSGDAVTVDEDFLYGDAGNDFLDGGLGSDAMDGGPGDDTFVFDATDRFVSGGNGDDTLIVTERGTLDFSNVSNIEKIDLDDDGVDQSVEISLNDVLNMTDADNVLQITGEGGDSVKLTGVNSGEWTNNGDQSFTNGDDTVFIQTLDDGVDIHVDVDDGGTGFDV